jgi:polysaccharide biosynthesis transport protein
METREALDVNFQRYAFAVRRSWMPALGALFTTFLLAAWYSTQLKPTYEADAKLLFKSDRSSVLAGLEQSNDAGVLRSLLNDQSPLNSEVEILLSRPLLQKTIDQLNLLDEDDQPLKTEDLKERLKVKILGATDVVQLSYAGSIPGETAQVVNTLADLYIKNAVKGTRIEAASTREFVVDQLPETEANVQAAERALREFRERNQVVALADEATSAISTLEMLETQIIDTQSALGETEAQANSLRGQLGMGAQEAMAVSAISESTGVQGVLSELQEVRRQLAAEEPRFTEENPVVKRLAEREAALERLLQREVRTTLGSLQRSQESNGVLQVGDVRQGMIKDYLTAEVQRLSLAQKLSSLQGSKARFQQRANGLPRLEQEQRELERRVAAAQATYETLLSKTEELQVKERQPTSNVTIIEPAVVPEKPTSSGKIKVLAIGLIAGSLLALAIVALAERKEDGAAIDQEQRRGGNGRSAKAPAAKEQPRV